MTCTTALGVSGDNVPRLHDTFPPLAVMLHALLSTATAAIPVGNVSEREQLNMSASPALPAEIVKLKSSPAATIGLEAVLLRSGVGVAPRQAAPPISRGPGLLVQPVAGERKRQQPLQLKREEEE